MRYSRFASALQKKKKEEKMSLALLLIVCLASLLPYPTAAGGNAGNCPGATFIGALPTLAHAVSGDLYVVDSRNFCIDNFTYDGNGPDAFLYFYYPGDPIDNTGGGVYVPLTPTQRQFQLGRRYDEEVLMFTLPMGLEACDFEGFSIWCRYANQLFTSIEWDNSEIFANIECRPSPGAFVGTLPTMAHMVSGQLYIQDNKTFVIRDFIYDGRGPDSFVYPYLVGQETDPTGGGIIIPLTDPAGIEAEEGRFTDVARQLPQADLVIEIPESMSEFYTCDFGIFTIWCRRASSFFSILPIDGELFSNNPLEVAYKPDLILCDRPDTTPGFLVGELPTSNSRAISGTFYVQDRDTFFIQLFSYDATREETYLYYYPIGVSPDTTGDAGARIAFSADAEAFPTGNAMSFFNNDFPVDLGRAVGDDIDVCDIGYFTILDEGAGEQLTMIEIPQAARDSLMCGATTIAGAPPQVTTLGVFGALATALLTLILKP